MTAHIFRRHHVVFGGLAVVMALSLALGVVLFEGRLAHAGGTGGPGTCFPVNGSPSCHFKGFNTSAGFTSGGDASNCILTSVGVSATDNVTKDPGNAATGGPFVGLFIIQFDTCNNFQTLAEGQGTTSTADLHTTGSLESASVHAVVPVTDFLTGATTTYNVNVTWQGVGPITSTIDSQHIRTTHFLLHTHISGDNREGVFNGTVAAQDGSVSYALHGTTTMFSATAGTLEIIQQ